MSPTLSTVLCVALSFCLAARAYSWPDHRVDTLESMLYEQSGFASSLLITGIEPCDSEFFTSTTGRTDSAEWFRTAYHDMATANVHAGTGGIDASIGFESDRPENVGKFINESLGFFVDIQSPVSGMADIIALAATLVVGMCSNGSVIVPYSAGRVDATEAGPFGVPQPQEPLETHISEFARQGFTADEMIGLVACGHTLGGVHGADFPTIVPVLDDPNNEDSRVDFDGSFASFDNSVAVQFVNNVTQNPLAFGPNVTTRSDHRIFTSDGGVIIGKMAASIDYYFETCASLLERMLNTVPRGVELIPVLPIPVKPQNLELSLNSEGMLSINGSVRLMEGTVVSEADPPVVNIRYTPRNGRTCTNCTVTTSTLDFMRSFSLYNNTPSFRYYEWVINVPASVGISGFLVEVVQDNGSVKTYGNEEEDRTSPFPIQDLIIVDLGQSCQSLQNIIVDSAPVGSVVTFNMTVLVLDSAGLQNITLTVPKAIPQQGTVSFRFEDESVQMTRGDAVAGGYTTYTTSFEDHIDSGSDIPTFTLGITGTNQRGESVGYDYFSGLQFCF